MEPIKRENAGDDLLKFIHDKRITQKQIAEKCDLTEATISRIINGLHIPNRMTLLKINKYLSGLV